MKFLLMTSYSGIGANDAPSMGLYRLQHVLKESGIGCDVLDLSCDDLELALKIAAAGEYQAIGMSVTHYHMEEDLEVLARFKRVLPDQALLIAGGQEATHNYQQWLEAGIDFVFLGYAEPALKAFAELYKQGIDHLRKEAHTINGIAFLNNGAPIFKPTLPLTAEEFKRLHFDNVLKLDIPFKMYWDNAQKNAAGLNFGSSVFISETVRLYTSTHCPNRCGFCSSHRFLSVAQQGTAPLFTLSAKQILQLIKRFVGDYGAKGFLFCDDDFLVRKERIASLCDLVCAAKKSGELPKSLALNCQARITDFMTGDKAQRQVDIALIDKMAQAGFHSIGLGVETFSERLLACPSMNKRGFSKMDAQLAIDALLSFGLTPQINIIMFIPEATMSEIKLSIEYALDFVDKGCQTAVTPFLHSIPGAPIYGSENLSVRIKKFLAATTGGNMEISTYLLPQDPFLAECTDLFNNRFEFNYAKFKNNFTWPFEKIPKTATGILMFISAAELFDDQDLVARGWKTLDALVRKTLQGGTH